MNAEQWRRLRDLFAIVQELPEADRRSFLDRELAQEPDLRAELERLLAAGTAAGEFLCPPADGESQDTVGPYRLLELLGEGGFGVVYLAEQTRPIRRPVALKLIKPGMDTKRIIARFEAERQALALMDHPGIAQIFEAGETTAGCPYFAMEYVPGVPITTFCDRERLSIPDRLELFAAVCDAVQHAHQKGVIHRDIKPSNVLVFRRDGTIVPKVIDFGIVKATTDPLASGTLMTTTGEIVGTLGYMSPEQAGAAEAVDTRTDIYSLGVVLYELLCGAPPFDPNRLRRTALSEAVRVIQEEEPPALVAQVARNGDRNAEIAAARSLDLRRLLRALKGELEWIALRTLEKDPNHRYASAGELAADVRRHLVGEPVLAGAPSTIYRLRKFARRHRVGVAAAAFVLLAILTGGIAAGIGFSRAVRAERAARREADTAQRVADFLVEMFYASSPDRSRGQTITARDLLDGGTRRVAVGLQQDPHVRSRLLTAMGNSYLNLGLHDEGVRLLREALASSQSARPTDNRKVGTQLEELAGGLRLAGSFAEAESLLDQAIVKLSQVESSSPAMAGCLWQKAALLNDRAQLGPADSLVTIAIHMLEAQARTDTLRLIRMYQTKANVAHRRLELNEAERSYLTALQLSEQAGRWPSWSINIRRRLASVYAQLGLSEQATSHAEESVRLARLLYTSEHPNLADALGGLAAAHISQGRLPQAIEANEEALRILRANSGLGAQLGATLNSLGILYRSTGQHALAIARAEEAWGTMSRVFGARSGRAGEMQANLARCYAESGRPADADAAFRNAITVLDRVDPEGFFTRYAYAGHAKVCRTLGRLTEADSRFQHAEAGLDSAEAGVRPYFAECLSDHAYLRSLQGRHAAADSMMRTAFTLFLRDRKEDDEELGSAYVTWAAARARAGDASGAIDALQRAARCGVTAQLADAYPELKPLRSRSDYPLHGRQ